MNMTDSNARSVASISPSSSLATNSSCPQAKVERRKLTKVSLHLWTPCDTLEPCVFEAKQLSTLSGARQSPRHSRLARSAEAQIVSHHPRRARDEASRTGQQWRWASRPSLPDRTQHSNGSLPAERVMKHLALPAAKSSSCCLFRTAHQKWRQRHCACMCGPSRVHQHAKGYGPSLKCSLSDCP